MDWKAEELRRRALIEVAALAAIIVVLAAASCVGVWAWALCHHQALRLGRF